jgi:hypothetical protein
MKTVNNKDKWFQIQGLRDEHLKLADSSHKYKDSDNKKSKKKGKYCKNCL